MMVWRVSLVTGVITGALAVSSVAHACSCRPRSNAERLATADVAIEGTVLSVRRAGEGRSDPLIARLRVTSTLKGTVPRVVTLNTRGSSSACGINFVKGETYRLTASREPDGLHTGLCQLLRRES